jgi:membrane-bound metal-dependent hydrolase YbcI (DUF457 family)
MYALGHLGLGYIIGKTSAKLLRCDVNIYALLILSLLPDGDLLLRPFLRHRGPTHSVVVASILVLPFVIAYGRTVAPYALTLVTHSLIGDAITGGAQLLWPISAQRYGIIGLHLFSVEVLVLESAIFSTALLMLLKTDGIKEVLAPFHRILR